LEYYGFEYAVILYSLPLGWKLLLQSGSSDYM
jgi:hypothetical protein